MVSTLYAEASHLTGRQPTFGVADTKFCIMLCKPEREGRVVEWLARSSKADAKILAEYKKVKTLCKV